MGRRAVITINQSENDEDLKGMIQDLKKTKGNSNPYWNRSESVIAKMLVQRILPREHKRICGKANRA